MEENEMAKEPKMVTCKHCGAEIAASAKACPKCGGKNKKPFYKNPLLIALVVIVIIIAAATSGGDKDSGETNSGNTATESQKPEITYTAYNVSELMNDLDANALKAADKYKGQYVELTGKLNVIDSSGKYIGIFPDDGSLRLVGAQCYLKTDEQTKAIMDCEIGDTLIVKGKITDVGEVMGYKLNIDEVSKAH